MPSPALTSAQWQRARDVFVAALELPVAERASFVASHTAEEPALGEEVLRLLRLDALAADFLEAPAVSLSAEGPHLLHEGEVVAGRFAVGRLLGQGGMGEVYEAEDRVLGERVALKVMRPGSADPEHLAARFRQEVQLARRVTHPGVCRVHDVTFHPQPHGQPLVVLTMELLEGETLGDRLSREVITRPDALALAAQIAEALDAAHAHRVVHGDIKPENVFLTEHVDGTVQAQLTDFGLARTLEQEAVTGTPDGPRFGTPAYMAPELFEGRALSAQSDVYAFGLVVYRMLSGNRELWPTAATATGTQATPHVPPGLVDLDTRSRRALEKALDADPARRFSSAGALVAALTGAAGRRRRRLAWQVAGGAGAVAVAAVALFLWTSRLSDRVVPELGISPTVLLTGTSNQTGDDQLGGVTEVLRSQLAQSARFETIGPERVAATLAQMRRPASTPLTPALAREVALREGASLVVFSRLRGVDAGYELGVEMEQLGARPDQVRHRWTETFLAVRREELFSMAHRASTWIRTTAGESGSSLADHDRAPSDTTTSSWDALRLFGKAMDSHGRGDLPTAAVLLQESTRLDPEFAGAYTRLGDVLISLRRDREGYEAWARAIALGDRRQLTAREHLRLRGLYFEDIGDLDAAERAYRAYAVAYASDFTATFFLGSILRDRGRPKEALTWLLRATALRPAAAAGHVHLANTYLELGRLDEAGSTRDALQRAGHTEWATWLGCLVTLSRGDLAAALTGLESLRRGTDAAWTSRAFTLRASFLAEGDNPGAAIQELTDGLEFDASHGFGGREAIKWLHLAELLRRGGETDKSVAAIRRALDASADVRAITLAGVLFCRLGRVVDARQALARLAEHPDIPKVRRAQLRLKGEIAFVQGRVRTAVDYLAQASAGARFQQSRLFLVPGLQRVGRHDEALAILDDAANHPARFYDAPEPELPGQWAESVRGYIAALERQSDSGGATFWRRRLQIALDDAGKNLNTPGSQGGR